MNKKDYIIPSLALVCIALLFINNPIKQNQEYHNFADNTSFLDIPNFLNVITNLPFAFIGLYGLLIVRKVREKELRNITAAVFIGFLLLTLGSGYYHLLPNNETLVYDRIPIVIILMSFFAFIIYDCINERQGYTAFAVLNITGIISVVYWIISEHEGKGDLRWYGLIQFFPVIAIPLILVLYKSSFNYKKEIILIFIFFALAKFGEMFDKEIYSLLSYCVSGHTFKHLLMVLAGYEIDILMKRIVNRQQGNQIIR